MKRILILFTLVLTGCVIVYSQEKMEIEGAIIIKDSEDSSPTPGTVRFNPSTNDFEGWNGLYWASLTGNQYEIGEMMDQDGNTYPTVIIGGQEWMAANLRVTTYRNGSPITLIDNDAAGNTAWSTANYGAYAVYDTTGTGYPFDVNRFGNLYNWYAVADGRALCPMGWHVPTDAEWTTLIDYLDPGAVDPAAIGAQSLVAGGKMKEAGLAHWNSPNQDATNESGFTGLPGGLRSTSGSFFNIGFIGVWWSSTESGAVAWYRNLVYNNGSVVRVNDDKKFGFSVRCVRD